MNLASSRKLSEAEIESIPSPNPEYATPIHQFAGLYLTKSGYTDDATGNSFSSKIDLNSYVFEKSTTLYAKYITTEPNLNYKQGITNTILPNNKYETNPYFLTDYTINESIIIDSETIFNIYYGELMNFDMNKYGTITSFVTQDQAAAKVVLESDVIIDGGELSLSSIAGHANKQRAANTISGEFTVLDLNGYTIYIDNGGSLNGFGIVTNSKNTGGIYYKNRTIQTLFVVNDFKGGGTTTTSFYASYSPFLFYALPYLNCEVVFTPDSKLIANASLNANKSKYGIDINLIGKKIHY